MADAYDVNVLYLLVSSDDVARGYSYTTQPAEAQYAREFKTFKTTPHGQKAGYLPDIDENIRMTGERMTSRSRLMMFYTTIF